MSFLFCCSGIQGHGCFAQVDIDYSIFPDFSTQHLVYSQEQTVEFRGKGPDRFRMPPVGLVILAMTFATGHGNVPVAVLHKGFIIPSFGLQSILVDFS